MKACDMPSVSNNSVKISFPLKIPRQRHCFIQCYFRLLLKLKSTSLYIPIQRLLKISC